MREQCVPGASPFIAHAGDEATVQFCIMGSHTSKGADNGLYGEDPGQNPYSTGLRAYTYIPQEVRWNMEYGNQKSITKITQENSTFVHGQQITQITNQQLNKKNKPKKKCLF